MESAFQDEPLVFTVGHSTHPLAAFITMLKKHGVTLVADVRTVPRSRHNPQFNRETLPEALKEAGLDYAYLPGLGGWRQAQADSPNRGWRSPGFQGFADYMLTPEFEENLGHLMKLARKKQVALMCAEALPWRCHRSLIADALLIRGFRVEHIMSGTGSQPHRLTPFARLEGMRLTYPGGKEERVVEDGKK